MLNGVKATKELLNALDSVKKPQTNADRIREMSDEELAWELMTWRCEAVAKHHGVESQYPDTQKTILSWLKKPQRRISDDSFAPHATTCNFPK